MLKKTFLCISVLTLFSSCNEKFDQVKFEKQVTYEIFPQLMDSLHSDQRLSFPMLPVPPPQKTNDKSESSKKFEIDSADLQKLIDSYEKQKVRLYNDTVKLVTAISDSTLLLDGNDKTEFLNFYNTENKEIDTVRIDKKYKIDINRLKADKKIKFIYRSKLPERSEIWRTEYDFYLNSIVSISRIQFDKSKKFGVMTAGYTTGILNGGGFRIFIRKNEKGNWIIDKIILTEIS